MNRGALAGWSALLLVGSLIVFLQGRYGAIHRPSNNAEVSVMGSESRQFSVSQSRYRIPESQDQSHLARWAEWHASGEWTNDLEIMRYLSNSVSDTKFDWQHLIEFWGIVLDQNERAVAGARVSFTWSDLSDQGTSTTNITTSIEGLFSITGVHGKGASVSVQADGYRQCGWAVAGFEFADPTDRSFHRPDPNRPVLFRLIRKGPMEPLVKRERMSFRVDGQTGDLYLDLLGQRSVPASGPGVDLVVHAEHGPIREKEGARWYDWRVVLSVPDGGIQIGSECPPAAPEDGYQPQLEFSGKVEANRPPGEIFEWFFLKARGGQHVARIHLKVVPAPSGGGPPRVLLAEYVLNPAGSLGLEFYEEMQVADKYYVSPDPDYVPPRRE